ncbi:hypothetical protein OE88DRAFT_1724762 [Heliocybe sulcata]|uniref:NYN domain-containing protein n=1 Tax=Heliocybe sulcata TaxID=5364 RepID=A0A5C3N9C8_9AGAM|nr:hypothetical protein OE88DRAFT_1724762 [Heliocybe sulcata]
MGLGDRVAVFWDYTNCPLSAEGNGPVAVSCIRDVARQFGRVTAFRAYSDMADLSRSTSPKFRSQLQAAGISLIHNPGDGTSEPLEHMMIVDMLVHAFDSREPITIFAISGCGKLSYALSVLRLRAHQVVLVVPTLCDPSILLAADVVFEWERDILAECRSQVLQPPVRTFKPRVAEVRRDSGELLASEPVAVESSTALPETFAPFPRKTSAQLDSTEEHNQTHLTDGRELLDRLRWAMFPWVLYEDITSPLTPDCSQAEVPMPDGQANLIGCHADVAAPPFPPSTVPSSPQIISPSSIASIISGVVSQAMSPAARLAPIQDVDEELSTTSESIASDELRCPSRALTAAEDRICGSPRGTEPGAESMSFSARSGELDWIINSLPTPPDSTPETSTGMGTGYLDSHAQAAPHSSGKQLVHSPSPIMMLGSGLPTAPWPLIETESSAIISQSRTTPVPLPSITTITPPSFWFDTAAIPHDSALTNFKSPKTVLTRAPSSPLTHSIPALPELPACATTPIDSQAVAATANASSVDERDHVDLVAGNGNENTLGAVDAQMNSDGHAFDGDDVLNDLDMHDSSEAAREALLADAPVTDVRPSQAEGAALPGTSANAPLALSADVTGLSEAQPVEVRNGEAESDVPPPGLTKAQRKRWRKNRAAVIMSRVTTANSPSANVTPLISPPMPVPVTPKPVPSVAQPPVPPTCVPTTGHPQLPDKFKSLAHALDDARRRGNGLKTPKQVRDLVWESSDISRVAGTTSFEAYVEMAVQFGIVVQVFGKRYLALAKAWHGKV